MVSEIEGGAYDKMAPSGSTKEADRQAVCRSNWNIKSFHSRKQSQCFSV